MNLGSANLLQTTVWLAILIGTGVGIFVYALAKNAGKTHERSEQSKSGESDQDGWQSAQNSETGYHLVRDDGPAAKALVSEVERTSSNARP